ncbi:MAG: type II secretion system inner membrane protein GspF [Xanthomonadaceae bacterium]|nr:type II secretion system inner membrane protein GspF [Xanthomonadaceae bacterium]
MPAYEYVAAGGDGRQVKGVLDGDSARQVRAQLRDQGLFPLSVDEVERQETGRGRRLGMRRGVSANQLAVMTRQLATLVRAALPLEEALYATAQQTEQPRLTSLLLAVRARVMEGHTLADGLAEFPQAFPEIYRSTVAAGEQSGRLDLVLERLADWTESRQELQQSLRAAMIYPIFLVAMTLAVTMLLLAYVVPEVVTVFDNLDTDLPPLTQGLIALSDFLRAWGVWLAAAIVIAAWLFKRALRADAFRYRFHLFLLRLPLIAKLIRGVNAARFSRTLAILSAAGVTVLDALRISAATVLNLPMRAAVEHAAVRVREGAPIAKSLGASGLFPPLTIHLIASGESSGRLSEMLERAATAQEREMQSTIGTLMGVLGPVLILLMGALVLMIVLAILLPIFDFNQMLR